MSETFGLALTLVDTGAILFLLVYFVIILSDLECDYLNAQQCCSKLNFWTLPKLCAHSILIPIFLFYGYWILALINIGIASWFLFELLSVPKGNTGVYDPTEIHNRGQLKNHMRSCMIFIAWYLVAFFIYLYFLILSLLKGDPRERSAPIDVPEY